VLDTHALTADLARDPEFSTPASSYFSPDLHHPSFRTHVIIASAVLDTMASIAGEPAPAVRAVAHPLPSARDLKGEARHRMNAMMHLAVQGLEMGPLPPRVTSRVGIEAAGQGGDERVGEIVFSMAAAIELAPFPVSAHTVARPGLGARATLVALHTSGGDEPDFFPARSPEARMSAAFEPIGGWAWQRLELGALLSLDRYHDFGYFVRGEWRILYADVSSRGWEPDRFEFGVRLGLQPGRPGRNGN
jgi:hypothetical protein